MDNIVLMQVLKPLADLFDYFSDHILWQPLHDFEQVEDFASWRVLQNQVDWLVIPEVAIEFEHIFVTQSGLDNDLSFDLLFEVVLLELFLVHFLQSYQKIAGFVFCRVDVPEFSPPHVPHYLEVTDLFIAHCCSISQRIGSGRLFLQIFNAHVIPSGNW